MDKYIKTEKIGEGTYGTVYKALVKGTSNHFVALKKIKLEAEDEVSSQAPFPALTKTSGHWVLFSPGVIRAETVLICGALGLASMLTVFGIVCRSRRGCRLPPFGRSRC